MDTAALSRNIGRFPIDSQNPFCEGKTKKLFLVRDNPSLVIVVSKDDITAGDGKKHDVIPKKGIVSNEISCNGFRMLRANGFKDVSAFYDQDCTNSAAFYFTEMNKVEVVVRRRAFGSFIKRNVGVSAMDILPSLVVEFYLKTNNRRWHEISLLCDDPLINMIGGGEVELLHPGKPRDELGAMYRLIESELFPDHVWASFPDMKSLSIEFFRVFEEAWNEQGCTLIDFKFEFGFHNGKLLLSDVVDVESCRVVENATGKHLDKEIYRRGGSLEDVMAGYTRAMELTSRFKQA